MQKTPTYSTINGPQDNTCNLSGLELAGYVMKKLTEDQIKIDELANHNFDGNKKFVLAVVDFLKDIGWMGEDEKNKPRQQQPLQHLTNLPRNYIDVWHGSTNAWVDVYTEGVRNAAKVTDYWLDSFYKMGFGQKSNKQKDRLKIE